MAYTGRERNLGTTKRVRRAERIASFFITMGGIGTIVAVVFICAFLVYVVWPLFGDADVSGAQTLDVPGRTSKAPVIATGMDGHRLLSWVLREDGDLRVFRLRNGEQLFQQDIFPGASPTCWSFPPVTQVGLEKWREGIFGFADGSVRVARFEVRQQVFPDDEPPAEAEGLARGESAPFQDGVIQVTPADQVRYDRVVVTSTEMELPGSAKAVELIDLSRQTKEEAIVGVLRAGGELVVYQAETFENLMTGELGFDLTEVPLPAELDPARGKPRHLALLGTGTSVFLVWPDGFAQRYDTTSTDFQISQQEWSEKDLASTYAEYEVVLPDGDDEDTAVLVKIRPRLAETVDLVRATEQEVTTLQFLGGKTTFLVGDTQGDVRAWFPTKPKERPGTIDGTVLANARTFSLGESPVTSMGPSTRGRLVAVGYADGAVRLFQVTTGELLTATQVAGREPVTMLRIAPREDGLLAFTEKGATQWDLEKGHPAATFRGLFGRIQYEGMSAPSYAWQSTGGDDSFEPKFSFMPLVFGTLKATFYAMLMAAPIAILAAVFTTEFLDPRIRSGVKSTIEMMASLPSVVLGFLAALVLAPFVSSVLAPTLAALFLVPLFLLVGARLWQLLPTNLAIRWARTPRFVSIIAVFPLAILAAVSVGGWLEASFFTVPTDQGPQADIKRWLEGSGDGAGGWKLILLPLSALGVGYLMIRFTGSWQRDLSAGWTRRQCALFDIAKVGVWVLVSYVTAMALSELLAGPLGLDPRGAVGPDGSREGGLLGPYINRNAMVVGFAMGFAVIPIIYTLAEDALSSVPQSLREGSLGAGATPWQTATRIVIPTAMSGLFGALMIGLGRAVGETMIVLMAAGNTAIMDWNPFNGMRTLSANIATEMPEAAVGSTHYRVLFCSALVLFGMTLLINIGAEVVRRIFRRRFADL